ncbi:MAG: DUF2993 domain-containing protein [Microbacterium sp.]|uniref:LmeA family phospholipid-binding protein n=1 Tax=Microbacterium sp. TaxID=51671 RepID=UPI0039E6DEC1
MALVIVLALIVAAFFAGEWIARDLITKTVRQQLAARLDISADTEIDVDIPGSLLLQAATGRIDEATVSSSDVTVGDLSGQVSVTVHDIGIWDGGSISGGQATLSLDTAQVQALMSQVDGFPADTLGLSDPDVTMSTAISALGVSIPVGVALTPSADDGDLLLTPASLTVGGAQITADDLRSRFGTLADAVLQSWRVCIAQELPAGLTLTAVSVTGDRLVAVFAVDAGSLTDAALAQKGSC